MRMNEILPSHVREWVTAMINAGVKPKTLANLRTILSAVFTTGLNDQIIFIHPCKGVKTPTVPSRPITIITPVQFDVLYAELPSAETQLLIETEIETGLRWGELTELRVSDLDSPTRVFTISRAVVQVDPKFHPDGGRFFVKEYPKDGEWRRVSVSEQLTDKLVSHISAEALDDDDLLFAIRVHEAAQPRLRAVPDPNTLGMTEANAAGRKYKHGTLSGYNAGRCRCRHCTDAFAIYRAARRSTGKDSPRSGRRRAVATDGHIPRDWFRTQVWTPARAAAKLKLKVTVRDLRHAHASWPTILRWTPSTQSATARGVPADCGGSRRRGSTCLRARYPCQTWYPDEPARPGTGWRAWTTGAGSPTGRSSVPSVGPTRPGWIFESTPDAPGHRSARRSARSCRPGPRAAAGVPASRPRHRSEAKPR